MLIFQDRQTYQLIGTTLMDVHDKFGIGDRICATTTDNGANYVSAFSHFGEDPPAATASQLAVIGDNMQPEEEDDGIDLQMNNVDEELGEDYQDPSLPPHHRCSAHTLNLLAAVDISAVPGWSTGLRSTWRTATAKAQSLWNMQNRSSYSANQIKLAAKRKLKTPVPSR